MPKLRRLAVTIPLLLLLPNCGSDPSCEETRTCSNAGDSGTEVPDASGPLTISLAASSLTIVEGSSATLDVTVTRTGESSVVVDAVGLPSGVSVQPVTVSAKETTAKLSFVAAIGAKHGDASVFIQATSGKIETEAPLALGVRGKSGVLDRSFGTDGILPLDWAPTGIAVGADARIHAVGLSTPQGQITKVVRYDPDGKLDTGFLGGAIVLDKPGFPVAYDVDAKGRFVIATHDYATSESTITRLLAGAPDKGFGTDGEIAVPNFLTALRVQSNGGLLVGGSDLSQGLYVARADELGKPDPNYGTADSLVFVGPVQPGGAVSLAPRSDGGTFALLTYVGSTDVTVVSLDASGSPADFGVNGTRTFDVGGTETPTAILAKEPGYVAIGGTIGSTNWFLAQLEPFGSLDPQFGTGGIVTGGSPHYFTGFILDSDQRAIGMAAGWELARFDVKGDLDTTFGEAGYSFHAPQATPRSMAFMPDGRILVLISESVGTSQKVSLARVWP